MNLLLLLNLSNDIWYNIWIAFWLSEKTYKLLLISSENEKKTYDNNDKIKKKALWQLVTTLSIAFVFRNLLWILEHEPPRVFV